MSKTYLPTKNNLLKLKHIINQFKSGQKLLEQKELILKKKLEFYRNKEKELRKEFEKSFQEATDSFRMASLDVGIDDLIDVSNAIEKDETISIKYLTLMGVEIPSVVSQNLEAKPRYGLYNTTIAVDEAVTKFTELKKDIIALAELDSILIRIQEAIYKVQRRSNALKEIIIPRDEILAKKISISLDEVERDEFVRLKIVKRKN